MSAIAKRSPRTFNVWPGYVDALSALLMVVIFLVLIFSVAQFLLSQVLSGQESELAVLQRQVDELTFHLGLEEERNRRLAADAAELSVTVSMLTDTKAMLDDRVAAMASGAEADQARIAQQLMLIGSLQEDIDALRRLRRELEARIGSMSTALQSGRAEIGALRDRSKSLEAGMADARERTLLAQRTIEEKQIRIQALTALIGEQKQALGEERRLSASARAQIARLNQSVAALKARLEKISRALDLARSESAGKDTEIKDLGKRLNLALARRINTLESYRSEFFGRLRTVLGDNPLIRIEGDRFVFQAELLFSSGSAALGEAGTRHLTQLAATLNDLAGRIPPEIDWILRIDGHTDRVPVTSGRFPSNWELSTSRAVSVVRFLSTQGIPESHMAAAGFSKFHPLDPADTPAAYRKNRRIEIKLTAR
ncbi:flagellar motor protein MotB [Desulfosarcina alkanivorans]|uniref:Flagellar motor protein MotB n=1 Tax=Desulfosarcina alkanivorans TaxID=571177 RepID=A0A5K7YKB8_9BACT|nr:peptidoglycan -binding protein [Desulfosarcina alkanivorans]BBO68825.1 flagellar motor protein MotB [Desulfosarcina alkanivorans]